jgi:hypothetical protein
MKSSQSQSYVATDGQSASLSWNKAPNRGLRPDLCYCQTVADLFMWGALSDERTGLSFTNCCWSWPAQSFSGPSPVALVTIFYCLRFETSLFVASYDSQGYGGGIRPRLHTGFTMKVSWICDSSEGYVSKSVVSPRNWNKNTSFWVLLDFRRGYFFFFIFPSNRQINVTSKPIRLFIYNIIFLISVLYLHPWVWIGRRI